MRPSYLLVGLMLVSGASAQTLSTPKAPPTAPVAVVETSWRLQVFVPALYEDPMRANQDHNDLLRDQRATNKENVARGRQGENAIPLPTKKIAQNTPVGSTPMGVAIGDEPVGNKNAPAVEDPGPSTTHYVYEAKMKNTGEKIIKSIVWEYSLFDGESETSVGTHRFNSLVTIRPGKTMKVVGRSKTPPARIISARSSSELKEKYIERVTISQVSYEDGTVWQVP
jgi:hypothetical protein